MSIDECMRTHTIRQRNKWLKYFEWQWNRPTPDHWYLAQIARVIDNKPVYGYKQPKKLKQNADLIIPFQKKGQVQKAKHYATPDGIEPWQYRRALMCASVGYVSPKETDGVHG